jgi:hypothetical protein
VHETPISYRDESTWAGFHLNIQDKKLVFPFDRVFDDSSVGSLSCKAQRRTPIFYQRGFAAKGFPTRIPTKNWFTDDIFSDTMFT